MGLAASRPHCGGGVALLHNVLTYLNGIVHCGSVHDPSTWVSIFSLAPHANFFLVPSKSAVGSDVLTKQTIYLAGPPTFQILLPPMLYREIRITYTLSV